MLHTLQAEESVHGKVNTSDVTGGDQCGWLVSYAATTHYTFCPAASRLDVVSSDHTKDDRWYAEEVIDFLLHDLDLFSDCRDQVSKLK